MHEVLSLHIILWNLSSRGSFSVKSAYCNTRGETLSLEIYLEAQNSFQGILCCVAGSLKSLFNLRNYKEEVFIFAQDVHVVDRKLRPMSISFAS